MKLEHIIIGAGRSGTTSLVAYLKQHPSINFSKIKEVTYFSVLDHYNRNEEFLNSFFDLDEKLKTTSDTYLLMDQLAPERIHNYNPDIKLTVILRAPCARSYSNYHFSINHGYINKNLSFIDSEKLEKEILEKGNIIQQNNLCNFYGSLYHLHLSNWLTYFKKEQIFVCTTEQLKNNPEELMKNYFAFLGLENIPIHTITEQNKATAVKNKTVNNFLVNREHWLRKLISKPLQISIFRNMVINSNVVEKIKSKNQEEINYPPMTEEEKAFCQAYFKEDLIQLKKYFGIDFTA